MPHGPIVFAPRCLDNAAKARVICKALSYVITLPMISGSSLMGSFIIQPWILDAKNTNTLNLIMDFIVKFSKLFTEVHLQNRWSRYKQMSFVNLAKCRYGLCLSQGLIWVFTIIIMHQTIVPITFFFIKISTRLVITHLMLSDNMTDDSSRFYSFTVRVKKEETRCFERMAN